MFPPMRATPMAETIRNAMPILIAFQRFSAPNKVPTTALALLLNALSMSAAFFCSPLSFAVFAAAASFLEASPIAFLSAAAISFASVAADAARFASPLDSASLIIVSTAGLLSATVAANSLSVAQLYFGKDGRTPKSTAAITMKPSQTAIQSSLLSRVEPRLLSAITYPPGFEGFGSAQGGGW